MTVRVTSLTGVTSTAGDRVRAGTDLLARGKPGLAPWAKAGILITPSLRAHPVRRCHGHRRSRHPDAGRLPPRRRRSPCARPPRPARWLRLDSLRRRAYWLRLPDGVHWTTIGTTHLNGLSGTVQAGLFVTSPVVPTSSHTSESTYATATFDQLNVTGAAAAAHLVGSNVGAGPGYMSLAPGRYLQRGSKYVVGGSGDMGPLASGAGGDGGCRTPGCWSVRRADRGSDPRRPLRHLLIATV